MFIDNPDFWPTRASLADSCTARLRTRTQNFPSIRAGKSDLFDVILNPRTQEEFEAEHPECASRRGPSRHWSHTYEVHPRVQVDVIESYSGLIRVLRGKGLDIQGYRIAPEHLLRG